MTATYSLQDNMLTELPGMEKPEPQYAFGIRTERDAYNLAMRTYNEHINSLRTIPCSPECRGLWKDGDTLEEGKDYEVKGAGAWKWCTQLKGNVFAAPIVPVKSEDHWQEFMQDIWEMTGVSLFERTLTMAKIQQKYSLTKR